jgi:hypothetical protein
MRKGADARACHEMIATFSGSPRSAPSRYESARRQDKAGDSKHCCLPRLSCQSPTRDQLGSDPWAWRLLQTIPGIIDRKATQPFPFPLTYRIEGKRKPETSPLLTRILAAISTRIYETGNNLVKNVPGRNTDVSDSEWLAQLARFGLLRGSFIPSKDLRPARGLPLPR